MAFASFSDLRKSRSEGVSSFLKQMESVGGGESKGADQRFWNLELDQQGNGSATIRFLPAPVGEDFSMARTYRHSFKVGAKWFIEECPTTIHRDDCPVCKENTRLWGTDLKANKDIASSRKRTLTYITNILVVRDSKNPANNGKVFLYRFGKTIFDMIHEAGKPRFEDATPFDPTDPWVGANFNLRVFKGDNGFNNYDRSSFDVVSQIGDDQFIEGVWRAEHPLKEFTDPSRFKTAEELEKRFNAVINGGSAPTETAADRSQKEMERRFGGGNDRSMPSLDQPIPPRNPAPAPEEATNSVPWETSGPASGSSGKPAGGGSIGGVDPSEEQFFQDLFK